MDAGTFRRVIVGFRDALIAHREAINNLNVYPVPDGDTGTNMSLTLQSVVEELERVDDDFKSVCQAVSYGSLMGARGNSGVILSQIMRGLVGVIRDRSPVDATTLAEALSAAAAGAYRAVMKPVEGTILTVIREASEAAVTAAGTGAGLITVMDAARRQGRDALARTPEMLPVLADAGVVDAGGAGLLLLFDAALAELDGRPLPEPAIQALPSLTATDPVSAAGVGPDRSGVGASIADLRYEVMFFLDAPDEAVEDFKHRWAALGDSVVVVGGDGMWNCHVHTDDIGAAIEAGIAAGRPHRIRVTDLLDEVQEQEWVRRQLNETGPTPPGAAPRPGTDPVEPVGTVPCAVVAVGVGAGVGAILASLGVHHVVVGGQSMNPSTADLLAAVDSVPADDVVVLPNNKNVIAVAEQLDAETDRTVCVVPTRTIVEGIAGLMAFDPEASAGANQKAMAAAAAAVVTGEVTTAVRDSTGPLGAITVGDWLGIGSDIIRAVEPTLLEAAVTLLDDLVSDDHELLTVIAGADADPSTTAALAEHARTHHPGLEIEVHDGGQPLYPYYFGLE